MKGAVKAMMEELYPTAEDMLRDRAQYPTWKALAAAIKVSPHNVCDHRKRLGMERVRQVANKPKNFSDVSGEDISGVIKALFSIKNNNMVKKYKIVDPIFYENVCGYEGLEFIGEEQGATWRAIHNPSIFTEGRNQYE